MFIRVSQWFIKDLQRSHIVNFDLRLFKLQLQKKAFPVHYKTSFLFPETAE